MKTIKAWAVVDYKGRVIFDGFGAEIYLRRKQANEALTAVNGGQDGERVVRVTILWEDE